MLKALILAAGQGTRLKTLTDDCPKPMLRIGDKPLLEHTINLLKKHGIVDIAINLHHHSQVVIDYFGNGENSGVKLHYSIEKKLLGTAGAVKNLEEFFDETFVIVYGDMLSLTDLTAMIQSHQDSNADATIGLYRADNPHECGLVEMDDSNRIVRFLEKPRKEEIFTDLTNAGIYVIEPEIIKQIPPTTFFDFGHDLFPLLLKNGISIYGYSIDAYLIDIGTMEKYEQANKDYMKGVLKSC